ncbi:MAG: hypothetical protein ABWX94_01390, partial [Candidatus Saccharimonadales bacterium]
PVFIAPTNGTITKITLTNGANLSAGATAGSIAVLRKTAPTATVSTISLPAVNFTAFQQQTPALTAGTTFSTGDVYSFRYAPGVIGVALTGFLVTIEYTPSE